MIIRLTNLFTDFMSDEDYNKLTNDYRVREYGKLYFSTSNYSRDLQQDYPEIEILNGESIMVEIINEKYDIYDLDANIAFIDSISNYINNDLFYKDFNNWIENVEKLFLELYV